MAAMFRLSLSRFLNFDDIWTFFMSFLLIEDIYVRVSHSSPHWAKVQKWDSSRPKLIFIDLFISSSLWVVLATTNRCCFVWTLTPAGQL